MARSALRAAHVFKKHRRKPDAGESSVLQCPMCGSRDLRWSESGNRHIFVCFRWLIVAIRCNKCHRRFKITRRKFKRWERRLEQQDPPAPPQTTDQQATATPGGAGSDPAEQTCREG